MGIKAAFPRADYNKADLDSSRTASLDVHRHWVRVKVSPPRSRRNSTLDIRIYPGHTKLTLSHRESTRVSHHRHLKATSITIPACDRTDIHTETRLEEGPWFHHRATSRGTL